VLSSSFRSSVALSPASVSPCRSALLTSVCSRAIPISLPLSLSSSSTPRYLCRVLSPQFSAVIYHRQFLSRPTLLSSSPLVLIAIYQLYSMSPAFSNNPTPHQVSIPVSDPQHEHMLYMLRLLRPVHALTRPPQVLRLWIAFFVSGFSLVETVLAVRYSVLWSIKQSWLHHSLSQYAVFITVCSFSALSCIVSVVCSCRLFGRPCTLYLRVCFFSIFSNAMQCKYNAYPTVSCSSIGLSICGGSGCCCVWIGCTVVYWCGRCVCVCVCVCVRVLCSCFGVQAGCIAG
jgi:hypothetical protein